MSQKLHVNVHLNNRNNNQQFQKDKVNKFHESQIQLQNQYHNDDDNDYDDRNDDVDDDNQGNRDKIYNNNNDSDKIYHKNNDIQIDINKKQKNLQEDYQKKNCKKAQLDTDKMKNSKKLKNQIKQDSNNLQKKNEIEYYKTINKDVQKLNNKISDLKLNYESIDIEEKMFKKKNIIKQKQIAIFLKQKQRESKKRKKKLQLIKNNENRRISQKIQESKEQENKNKKFKVMNIKQLNNLRRNSSKIILNQQRKQKKSFQRLYLIKQKQDKQKRRQEQQLYQNKLLIRRDKFKPVEMDDIYEHQIMYHQKREELDNQKREQRQAKMKPSDEVNDHLKEMWRGNVHQIVQNEFLERKMKQKQKKQISKRRKQYEQKLRNRLEQEKFHHKKSNSANDNPNSISFRQNANVVQKYRYRNGIAIGKVLEKKIMAKSLAQQKNIGENYLQYVRQLPKRQQQQQAELFNEQQLKILNEKLNTIPKVNKNYYPLYKNKNNKVSIVKNATRDDIKVVLQKLNNTENKLKVKQNFLNNLRNKNNIQQWDEEYIKINHSLVSNIQKKLSLLSQL